MTRIVAVIEVALALLIFAALPGLAQEAPAEAPLFEGLGDHHHEVTTDSELAQRYFDQGLILSSTRGLCTTTPGGWPSPARATGPPLGRSSKPSPTCGTIRTSNG